VLVVVVDVVLVVVEDVVVVFVVSPSSPLNPPCVMTATAIIPRIIDMNRVFLSENKRRSVIISSP
jgi:hypothetical protein